MMLQKIPHIDLESSLNGESKVMILQIGHVLATLGTYEQFGVRVLRECLIET